MTCNTIIFSWTNAWGYFRRFLNDTELMKAALTGRQFTWSNERSHPTLIKNRWLHFLRLGCCSPKLPPPYAPLSWSQASTSKESPLPLQSLLAQAPWLHGGGCRGLKCSCGGGWPNPSSWSRTSSYRKGSLLMGPEPYGKHQGTTSYDRGGCFSILDCLRITAPRPGRAMATTRSKEENPGLGFSLKEICPRGYNKKNVIMCSSYLYQKQRHSN